MFTRNFNPIENFKGKNDWKQKKSIEPLVPYKNPFKESIRILRFGNIILLNRGLIV